MKSKLNKIFGSIKPLKKNLTFKQMRKIAMEDKVKRDKINDYLSLQNPENLRKVRRKIIWTN